MKIDVFISYHTDSSRHIVDAIVNNLEHSGIRCWYAPRDVEGNYAGSIKRAIDACSVFLIILNKAASESRHVLNEIDLAFSRSDVTILPFHVADNDISDDARYYLGRIHWIDAMTPDLSNHIQDLNSRVLKVLGRTPQPTATPAPQPTATPAPQVTVAKPTPTIAPPTPTIKTITYADGSVYVGEVVNGTIHGKGKCTFANGAVYDGDWVNGKRSGKGKYTFADGTVYEGDFQDGKRTGKGKFTDTDAAVYEGDFVDGKRTGKGRHTRANGYIYDGDFIGGYYTGSGEMRSPNGDLLQGTWKKGKLIDGSGRISSLNGDYQEGSWSGGLFTGKVRFTNKYHIVEGYMARSRLHGEVTEQWYNSATFRGTYQHGARMAGTIHFVNGMVYEGDCYNISVIGSKGKMTLPDGTVHTGTFRHKSGANPVSGRYETILTCETENGTVYTYDIRVPADPSVVDLFIW